MTGVLPGMLTGRCALITGGARGLGLAIARSLRAAGAAVVLFDRDEAVDAAATALGGTDDGAMAFRGSVTRPQDLAAAFDAAQARFGRVDIAVANAGVSQNQPSLEVSEADWGRVIDVNLTGVFLTAQEAGRRMMAGGGSILLMASMYGIVAAPERVGYCVSKAGVVMMAKALATEWAGQGVRVNALAPGYVRTPFLDDLVARGRLDLARLEARTPIGRLIRAEEVAQMAAFLVSDAAGAVTGQVVAVDGGWTAHGYL